MNFLAFYFFILFCTFLGIVIGGFDSNKCLKGGEKVEDDRTVKTIQR